LRQVIRGVIVEERVRASDLKAYLEGFHETLSASVEKYFPKEHASRLRHASLLPSRIVGTVSTRFGVAIEYFPAETTEVEVEVGSRRIEELVLDVPARLRKRRAAIACGGRSIGEVSHTSITGFMPIRLDSEEAEVVLCQVTLADRDWHRFVHYAEFSGNRRAARWSRTEAVRRAKDEVLLGLTELRRAEARGISIDEYVRERKKNTVLLLGSYDGEGKSRLGAIANELRVLGYDPILVSEIPDHPEVNLHQKVTLLGSISRFAVVDDTSPSGHLREIEICRNHDWVTVVLKPTGRGSSFMTAGLSVHSKVIKDFASPTDDIVLPLGEAVRWAEERLGAIREELPKSYPWCLAED
jgi:hypothetical protein